MKKNFCHKLLDIICIKSKNSKSEKSKKIKSPYNSCNEITKEEKIIIIPASEKIIKYHKNFPEKFQTEYFNKKEKEYYSKLLKNEKNSKKKILKNEINFEEIEKIEKGAFGIVSRGYDKNNKIEMAVKKIYIEKKINPENKKKIISEFEILQNLDHKNIIKVYGYKINKKKNIFNIYMEYLNEGSILNIIKNFKKLNEKVTSHYTYQILKGIITRCY